MKKLNKVLAFIMCFSLIASLASVVPTVSAYSGTTITSDNIQEIPTELGENLIADEQPMYVEYKLGDKSYTTKDLGSGNSNLTNGITGDSWHYTNALFAVDNGDGTRTFYNDGSAFCNIMFYLKKTADISKICVINHPTANLVTGKYEIYASQYIHELFLSDSLIASVDNTANYDYRQIITCSDVIKDVNYLAIKVIIPCKNVPEVATFNCYPRFSEFCVYGTEKETGRDIPKVANSCEKTNVTTEFGDADILNFTDSSKNFLYGKTTENGGLTLSDTYYHYYEKSFLGYVYSKGYEQVTQSGSQKSGSETYLTDGNTATDWYTSSFKFLTKDDTYGVGYTDYRDKNDGRTEDGDDDYDFYVDLLFDAGSSKELGLFYINHHNTEALRTMHYRIYASDSKTFTDSNIIADCVNYSGAQNHYITVANGQTVKARYYLIRVFNPCYNYGAPVLEGDNLYNNPYVRLNEVAAFTTDSMSAQLSFNEENLKLYGNDYLGGIKKGTTVKSIINGFTGVGNISVVDKNDNFKAPSKKINPGDKVVVDTGYGGAKTVNLAIQGDLNGSGTHTVSDVVIARYSVMNGVTDSAVLAAGDTDCSGSLTVTDVVNTMDAVLNGVNYTESGEIKIESVQKKGIKTTGTRKVNVDTDTVLTENFIGFGTNSFPSTLATDVSKKIGFNMVYNELNAERLSSLSLDTSRMWFQVDWLVTETCNYKDYAQNPEANPDYINYLNGVYDFDNQWMNAVYDYVGMLQDAGTDVEINFGWKTATRIQDWFGTPCDDPILSAPKDLDAFAAAAASLIEELHRRGYDNVKAITFYNEPNLDGDFQSGMKDDGHDDRIYWSRLVAKVDAEFTERGLDETVQIWGPECSGMGIESENHRGWLQYQVDNSAAYVDVWTGHHYYEESGDVNNYSLAYDSFVTLSKMTSRNMIITEMQGHVSNKDYKNWFSWNDSTAGYFIAASNTGIRGTFTWMTVGGYLPDPLETQLYGDATSAWLLPLDEGRANTVNRVFYEEALLTNYVPKGSQVLYTTWTGDDIRTSAYLLPDGNITVLVENNGYFSGSVMYTTAGVEKNIEIKIQDGITREFKRISYVAETQKIDANATVNSPDKTITATNGVLTDTLSENYSVQIYTTAPTIKQVQIKNAEVTRHIGAGGTTQIIGEMIDCENSDEIVYSISEYTGTSSGTVSKDGLYTAAADAKAGDMVAVRASLKSDPSIFAVAIIYID